MVTLSTFNGNPFCSCLNSFPTTLHYSFVLYINDMEREWKEHVENSSFSPAFM